MRPLFALSLAFAALVGACSQPNKSHCANLEGDATCNLISVDAPYCSRCIAENNGCVAEPITDNTCEVGSTSIAPATSTTTPTTSTTATETTASVDPDTTSPTTTSTTDPTTSSSTSTTTTGTTTTTGDTTTSDTTAASTGDTTTGDTTAATTTTGDTTTTTDETTTDVPMCGDNLQEDPEICDGTDLNGLNCVTKNPTKYGGGALKCGGTCMSYDETMCCLAQDQPCTPNSGQKCCPDLSCTLILGLGKCKP